MKKIKETVSFEKWFDSFTKKAVALILVVSLIDLQLSYILAFMGRDQIAETLSITVVETIIGVMLGYFCKALIEKYLEEREKRLLGSKKPKNKQEITEEE